MGEGSGEGGWYLIFWKFSFEKRFLSNMNICLQLCQSSCYIINIKNITTNKLTYWEICVKFLKIATYVFRGGLVTGNKMAGIKGSGIFCVDVFVLFIMFIGMLNSTCFICKYLNFVSFCSCSCFLHGRRNSVSTSLL